MLSQSSRFLRALFVSALAAFAHSGALTAEAMFPVKPLTLLLPYGPGAASDVVSRVVAEAMGRQLGQPVVLLNRPGGNGMIALNAARMAPADGYTVYFSASSIVNEQAVKRSTTFNVQKDVVPVGRIASAPLGVFVSHHLPVSSLAELIDYAKKNPGKVTYASPGVGSVIHLAVERLRLATGMDLLHVPYPAGTAPVLTAMVAGDVLLYVNEMGSMRGLVADRKVKVLGTLDDVRSPLYPDAVSAPEMGLAPLKNFSAPFFFGLYVMPGTPEDRVQLLNRALNKAMEEPGLQSRLKSLGYVLESFGGTTPGQFRKIVLDELARAETVVRQANIQVPQ